MIEPIKLFIAVALIIGMVINLAILAHDCEGKPILNKDDKQAWPLAILFTATPFAIAGLLTGNL